MVRGLMEGNVDKMFAPVVEINSVRTDLTVAVQRVYYIQQMYVRTAFLHGVIN